VVEYITNDIYIPLLYLLEENFICQQVQALELLLERRG